MDKFSQLVESIERIQDYVKILGDGSSASLLINADGRITVRWDMTGEKTVSVHNLALDIIEMEEKQATH